MLHYESLCFSIAMDWYTMLVFLLHLPLVSATRRQKGSILLQGCMLNTCKYWNFSFHAISNTEKHELQHTEVHPLYTSFLRVLVLSESLLISMCVCVCVCENKNKPQTAANTMIVSALKQFQISEHSRGHNIHVASPLLLIQDTPSWPGSKLWVFELGMKAWSRTEEQEKTNSGAHTDKNTQKRKI